MPWCHETRKDADCILDDPEVANSNASERPGVLSSALEFCWDIDTLSMCGRQPCAHGEPYTSKFEPHGTDSPCTTVTDKLPAYRSTGQLSVPDGLPSESGQNRQKSNKVLWNALLGSNGIRVPE